MRVYILDWHGTLTTLGERGEIKAFLDALHLRGDYTIGYSGMLPKGTRDWFTFGNSKDLGSHFERLALGPKAEAWMTIQAEGVERKFPACRFMDPATGYQESFDPSVVTEVVFSDDSAGIGYSPTRMAQWGRRMGRPPVRFVAPKDLHKEVSLPPLQGGQKTRRFHDSAR